MANVDILFYKYNTAPMRSVVHTVTLLLDHPLYFIFYELMCQKHSSKTIHFFYSACLRALLKCLKCYWSKLSSFLNHTLFALCFKNSFQNVNPTTLTSAEKHFFWYLSILKCSVSKLNEAQDFYSIFWSYNCYEDAWFTTIYEILTWDELGFFFLMFKNCVQTFFVMY